MIAAHDFYENEYAKFWIEDGILIFKYSPGIAIDLDIAMRVVADRIALQNERHLPVLCDSRGVASTDKPSRDYLANSGSLLAKAVALLVGENVSMMVSSFYLEISRPAVPTKIFTTQEEALAFLSEYL